MRERAENLIGDIIYAFDRDGYFCTIDPDTFDRTIYEYEYYDEDMGTSTMLPVNIADLLWEDPENIVVVDFAYEYEMFYVVVMCNYECMLLMFNPLFGAVELVNADTSLYRPSNLICKDGMLIWVDDFQSSWLCRVSIYGGSIEEYSYAASGSWGYFYGSAGMWEDPLTGTVYVLRGKGEPEMDGNTNTWVGTDETDLWIIDLHGGTMTEIGNIGQDVTRLIMGVYLREPTAPTLP